MMNFRRIAAVAGTGALAAASIVFFGVAPASALPTGFALVSGSVTESSTATTTTLTQTSPTAVVEFTNLQLNAGEALEIVQPDDDAILVILADSVAYTGTITALGTVIIASEGNFTAGSSSFVGVGANLVLTTGAVDLTDLDAGLVAIDSAPDDEAVSLVLGAAFTAGGTIGVIGADISSGADIIAGTAVGVAATENAAYEQGASPAITTTGAGLGAVGLTGSITAPSVRVHTPAPATQSIDSVIRGTRGGADGGASTQLSSGGVSPDLNVASVVGGGGPLAQLGGYATGGASSLPVAYSTASTSVEVAGGMPATSTAILANLEVAGSLSVSIIQTRCLTEDGLVGELGIGATSFDGAPFVPAGFDFAVPNQPGIELSDTLTVYFNVQEYTTVGGYEVLTTTAVRLVGEMDSIEFGVVSCAVPAAAVLASTGAERMDVVLAAGGAAVLLGVTGVVIATRRRRVLR